MQVARECFWFLCSPLLNPPPAPVAPRYVSGPQGQARIAHASLLVLQLHGLVELLVLHT